MRRTTEGGMRDRNDGRTRWGMGCVVKPRTAGLHGAVSQVLDTHFAVNGDKSDSYSGQYSTLWPWQPEFESQIRHFSNAHPPVRTRRRHSHGATRSSTSRVLLRHLFPVGRARAVSHQVGRPPLSTTCSTIALERGQGWRRSYEWRRHRCEGQQRGACVTRTTARRGGAWAVWSSLARLACTVP
jgi:hypothetical protein